MISSAQIADACGCALPRAENWRIPLVDAMDAYDIDTPARQAAFLAQVAHESGHLRYVAEIWGPTDPQRRYEGRADLGNTEPGDGFKFRGRGLIQITGRANYVALRDGLIDDVGTAPDFVANPADLEIPRWAALSAAWFWHEHSLNQFADSGVQEDFVKMTRRINGGTNGLDDRLMLWGDAKKALGV